MDSRVAPPPETSSDENPVDYARARAFYCRVQAGIFEQHAEKASGSLKREYADLAQQWLALEKFHKAEAARMSGAEPVGPGHAFTRSGIPDAGTDRRSR